MTEPDIFIDYEFHFAHGEPLFVELKEGRDSFNSDPDAYRLTIINPESETHIEVVKARLNGFTKRVRVVQPEKPESFTGEPASQP